MNKNKNWSNRLRIVLPWLKNYWPVLVVFLFSLSVNIAYFNWQSAPIWLPDGVGYFEYAKILRSFHLYDTASRVPIYPLFLALFVNKIVWATYIQAVLLSVASVFLYLIINKIIKIRPLAFILTLFLVLDFMVISYNPLILTESLSIFLITLFTYLHIEFFLRRLSWLIIIGLIISDILVIFIRPVFVFLPISIYLLMIAHELIKNRAKEFFKKNLKLIGVAITINLLLIVSYCSYNYKVHNYFGFSGVWNTNLVSKWVNYGYLIDDRNYDDAPYAVKRAIYALDNYGEDYGEFAVLKVFREDGADIQANFKEINKYLMSKYKWDYARQTLKAFPRTFILKRISYSKPGDFLYQHKKLLWFYNQIETSFDYLNQYKLIGSLLSIFILIIMAIYRRKEFYPLLIILFIVFYNMALIAGAGIENMETVRLRVVIEWQMNFLVLLPIFLLLSMLWEYLARKSSKIINR